MRRGALGPESWASRVKQNRLWVGHCKGMFRETGKQKETKPPQLRVPVAMAHCVRPGQRPPGDSGPLEKPGSGAERGAQAAETDILLQNSVL